WLKVNSFEDIAGLWIEQIPAARRLELLTALALADPATDLLVVDSPDRHSADPAAWLPRLQALASDAGRPLAVVAVVGALPDNWTGAAAVIGNSVMHPPEPEADAAHSETEPAAVEPAQAKPAAAVEPQPAAVEPKAKHAAEPTTEEPETLETPAAPQAAADPESENLQRTAK
ncbi:MAG: hypothetical protein WB535_15285, partial [Paenarthrobacter sp.]